MAAAAGAWLRQAPLALRGWRRRRLPAAPHVAPRGCLMTLIGYQLDSAPRPAGSLTSCSSGVCRRGRPTEGGARVASRGRC